jgi:hypothetical protein
MRSHAFQQALPVIAGFIAERTGIKIRRGASAWTDSESITLPRLPELTLTPEEVSKTVGYLYHEAFHIRESDFSLQFPNALVRSIEGLLEDIRIERKGMSRFPAARFYLDELVRQVAEAGMRGEASGFQVVSADDTAPAILQIYGLALLRHDLLGQRHIAPILDAAKRAAQAKFPASMLVKYEALLHLVTECEREADCLALAGEIAKMIREEEATLRQPPPETSEDTSSAAPASNVGTSPQEADPAPATSDEGDVGAGSADAAFEENLDALLQMKDDEVMRSVGEMAAQALNAVARRGRGAHAVTMPNVHTLKLPLQRGATDALKASVNGIRTRTLQWMASAAESDVTHSRAGTLIDPARLHLARQGGEIFLSQSEGIDLNAALVIVIDRSSSMAPIIQTVARAALAMMLAYDVPGLATQVVVFPVNGAVRGQPDVGLAVLKDWDESTRDMAGRLPGLPADGWTPMAEAVLFAAVSVSRRPETLKVVLAVTDGEPDDEVAAHEVIDHVRGAGIAVLGLGIGVNPDRVFGPMCSASVSAVGELASTMARLFRSAIRV